MKKKIIQVKLPFRARLEMLWLKFKLFGIRRNNPWGVTFKDVKELFKPKKLECLFG